ncbi:sentrin-specific protease 1-like [Venturia canescens]|uniref:sentrin-specific protease 1-like n=1 Tax=Venturia canescens TaxID=32260 RepID=UPI001C9D6109|nr:sentrin-specific protease 1-like [Venturia canescens]
MDASTQTIEVVRKNFAQQTDGGKGEWVKEEDEVEILEEVQGRKEEEDVTIIAVPNILSPIREVEDKGEEWKEWRAGEFIWIEDVGENTENNHNRNKKKKSHKEQEQIKKTKEETIKEEEKETKEDKGNKNNKDESNEKKGKKDKNDGQQETKKIKKEAKGEDKENTENNNDNINNNENKRKRTDDNGERRTKRIKIKQEDLETLSGTNWLNDEIINNYFELYRKVIVPIHLGNHWCLAVIDMLFGEICYYDSFKGSQPAYLATLLEYLVQEAKEKNEVPINKEEWTLGNTTNIPCQTNGYDCGVFTCQFARYEVANRAIDFTQQDMPQIRAKMARELQAGCLED